MPISAIREITELSLRPLRDHVNAAAHLVHPPLDPNLDLNFPGVETQHSTHSMHPYVAAINPPLAAALIRHYVPEGERVLDPFCGGGGVLLEAALNGRNAIGCDVNPLAVICSRAKTTHVSTGEALSTLHTVEEQASSTHRSISIDDVPSVVSFWYREDSLAPLQALKQAVLAIPDEAIRTLFRVILSATARDTMLTYRGEIRLRKLQGKDLDRFQPNVFAAFRKRAMSALARVASLPSQSVRVAQSDCRVVGEDFSSHTVITSPPYGDDKNGVGYFQFSRNMLFWIGYSLEEQKAQKEQFLGSMKADISSTPEVPSLDNVLQLIKERKKSHYNEARSFYADYYQALLRISKLASHRVIIIVGDRVLSRTKINNGHITTEFMQKIGWHIQHYYDRELRKKRIANLGGDGGGISLEHIMVFQRDA